MKWLKNKLEAFEQAISNEFQKFVRENYYIRTKNKLLINEIEKLKKVLQNYELNMTKDLIRSCGNLQAIDVYISKPQIIRKKNKKKSQNLDYLNFMNEENLNILSSITNKTKKSK